MGKITKSFFIVLIISASSQASVESFFNNKTDGSYSEVSPGYFRTQNTHNQTFGSMRVRWDTTSNTSALAHITKPSMSVGCNGIDLSFGSFSYLDPQEFIEKAKKIAQAAPAFAFKMALSTLCKECDSIMQELEAATDMLNSLSMDSCAVAEAGGSWMGEAIGDNIRTGGKDYFEEYKYFSDPANNSDNLHKYVSNVSNALGGNWDINQKKKLYGSAIDFIVSNNNTLAPADKNWIKSLMRGLYGDLVVVVDTKEQIEKQYIVEKSIIPNELVTSLLDGKPSEDKKFMGQKITLIEEWNTPVGYTITPDDLVNGNDFYKGGATANVETKLNTIKTHIEDKTQLEPADITFLNSVSIPVWKAINLSVTLSRKNQSYKFIFEDLTKSVAVIQVENLFNYFSKIAKEGVSLMQANTDNLASKEALEALSKWSKVITDQNKAFVKSLNNYKTSHGSKSSSEINKNVEDQIKILKSNALTNISAEFN